MNKQLPRKAAALATTHVAPTKNFPLWQRGNKGDLSGAGKSSLPQEISLLGVTRLV
jgi:hypothetical protein